MNPFQLKFHAVTFSYDSSAGHLFKDISFNIAEGWTGVAGANGTGKTTLLKLATGHLIPEKGIVESPKESIYCMQRTDEPPGRISEFLLSGNKEGKILKEQLEIGEDWGKRWHTLSHGERKRLQLGQALWMEPDLLAVDEPTNHLDSYARVLISDVLSRYKGIGLLVSHDRELMDRLCKACIFTVPPGIIIRPGGITHATAAIKQEQEAAQRQYNIKKKVLKKFRREAMRRKQEARQADHKRSKRHIDRKDHDASEKIDIARITGKDGHAGKLQRQLQGRLNQLQQEFDKINVEKKYSTGIWLPGSISKRDFLLRLPAGSIRMGEEKYLSYPDLLVKPADRIAVTGPNGSGKSTLIRHILEHLNIDKEHVTYVPQEIDIEESKKILDTALGLQKDRLGHLMAVVSRLNSRPERLLSSIEPSPGEIRKLLLALGMSHEPYLIIMDEPTNHLDLPSIESLENALSECPCALILVSHDMYFLRRLADTDWRISGLENGPSFKLEVRLPENYHSPEF